MFFILSKWFLAFSLFTGSVLGNERTKAIVELHPFYVSVTEVNHNATTKTLEVSCKFFADDFEHTLETAYKAKLDISTEKDKASFDKYITDYIGRHLLLSADGKAVKLNFVGYEKEKESVYCYFEVSNVNTVSRLDIINTLLYELTQEQINIMHITVNGKRQSSKLSYPAVKATFQF